MPLGSLLKSAAGTCPFCHQRAGIISREHPECRRAHQAGWHEMVQLATQAAGSRTFDEKSLRLSLTEIARRSYGDGATVNQSLEEGLKGSLPLKSALCYILLTVTLKRERTINLRRYNLRRYVDYHLGHGN